MLSPTRYWCQIFKFSRLTLHFQNRAPRNFFSLHPTKKIVLSIPDFCRKAWLGKEFKRIPNKNGHICPGFFLTPSPTSAPDSVFPFFSKTNCWGKCLQHSATSVVMVLIENRPNLWKDRWDRGPYGLQMKVQESHSGLWDVGIAESRNISGTNRFVDRCL